MVPKNGTNCDAIISFLKSDEFQEIIRDVVISETQKLNDIIEDLKIEVENLKQSNIELVKLFDNGKIPINNKNLVKNNFSAAVNLTPANKTPAKKVEVKASKKTLNADKHLQDKKPEYQRYKNRSKNLNIVQDEGEESMTIRGVIKFEHFHVYRLDVGLDEATIINHLRNKNINDAKCVK